MKLNEMKPARGATKKRKRLGCGTGSGHGGTSTRGHKGLYSRSGGGVPPWFEGGQMPLQRRIPKRGFFNFTRVRYEVVNVGDLARFEAGMEVGLPELIDARLVRRTDRPVKILGTGTIEAALTVRVHAASKTAIEKIEQSGGKVEILSKA
jgi:large subunit ribosomal protein L15